MATVGRVEAIWQNFIGAPGYSRFTFDTVNTPADATTVTGKVRAFFFAIAALIPNGATVQVQAAVPTYDAQTGVLFGEVVAPSAPAIVTGTASASAQYAGGAGAFVGWKTSNIWQGRRVQGRTFLVPLAGVSDTNGTITASALATLTAAANGLIAPGTPAFGVWAKKFLTNADGSQSQIDGSFFLGTGISVPDKTGILRSRRD